MSGNTHKRYPAELKQRGGPDVCRDQAGPGHRLGGDGQGGGTARDLDRGDGVKWVRQAEIDQGERPGMSSEESAEIKRLKRRTPS